MKSNPSTSNAFGVLSGLAHEIDSPLKSILARTRKLIKDYKNRDFEFISFKDFKVIISTLEQMERQLQYCSHTSSRMLSTGKRQARLGENNCQMNATINHVVHELSQQLKSPQIKLALRLSKELPRAALGPIEAHQIIHNILLNSVQAMPGGGSIKVKTFLDKENKVIVINVVDEGVGISPEHLSKVFEPFFTTRERGIEKSSGLGLSITRSIIEAAGGSIHIKSSLRSGTVVHITLPVYQSK